MACLFLHVRQSFSLLMLRSLAVCLALQSPAAVFVALSSNAHAKGPSYPMKAVPAGTYEVGCTAAQSGCRDNEMPAHMVKLTRGVLMGQTEVTQALWRSVMGNNPSEFQSCGPTCPVENVDWLYAVMFANALSKRDGLEACYTIETNSVIWPRGLDCTGYRLPTEAEWEVAARGGQDSLYAGGSDLGVVGWTKQNSGDTTHPVRGKAANGYGLYDMTGNVWEWTWDRSYAYKSNTQVDPVSAVPEYYFYEDYRSVRGGGWCGIFFDSYGRVADRMWQDPLVRRSYIGVRLARTIP
jgi:formylglycine-generating enzyme required for sulfatase activity